MTAAAAGVGDDDEKPDRPGPDDLPAALRGRVVALIADLERDRDALAGHPDGAAAVDALIDAARRVLDTLDGRPNGVG